MSLISEALKKAQQEREKQREDGEIEPQTLQLDTPSLFPRRRLIFIAFLVMLVIVAVMAVYLWYQPSSVPEMQALNLRNSPQPSSNPHVSQPVTKPATQPITQPDTRPAAVPLAAKNVAPPLSQSPVALPTSKPITQPSSLPQTKPEPVSPTPKVQPAPQERKPRASKPERPLPQGPHTASKKEVQAGVKVRKEVSQPPTTPRDAAAYAQEGDRYMENNNALLAVEEYKKALALNPSAEFYLKLYTAFKVLRNSVLMRAYIDEGLVAFPEDFYLNKVSAILYIRSKDFRKAQANITAALAVDGNDYSIHTYQGLCYFHSNDYNNALTAFQKSLQLNSDAVENYYYMGLIFDNQKQYARALEYYTAFIKLNTGKENFKHQDWVEARVRLLKASAPAGE